MKKKKMLVTLVALTCTVSLYGCGSGAKKDDPGKLGDPASTAMPDLSKDPVTIKISASTGMLTDDELKKYIQEPVQKKYPQITVERTTAKLDELLTTGDIPDIVASYPGPLGDTLTKYQFLYNIEPLVKKYRFDQNRFSPEVLETLKVAGGQDYLVGLPAYTNAFALFYNKDIFDKFGVPYPKDGMYWDEIVEVAKKLTRIDSGVQYRGIFPDGIGRIQQQLSINFVDFKTNKSLLGNEQWKQAYTDWGTLFKIPGLSTDKYKVPNAGNNQKAFQDGTLAMIASHTNFLQTLRTTPNITWEMVTYPQFRKTPGIGQRLDSPILAITAQSKAKDAAFLVLDTLLSDGVQMDMQRNGRMTVLKDDKFKPEFGKSLADLNGKNLVAMTKLKFAVMTPFKYIADGELNTILTNSFNAYIADEKDLNTALREADDLMTKLIADKQVK